MQSYLDLLAHVMAKGKDRTDRTGVGTRSVFGYQWRHHMSEGFPLLTTKKLHIPSIIHELLWFLRGETNVRSLQEADVKIWNEWADKDGELGPVYGKQWRNWEARTAMGSVGIDQIANLVRDLKATPFSRRHIVSAWNPADVPDMKLPPCHTLWQCYMEGNGKDTPTLHLHLYARSIDAFLGLPFNIASYAFLLHMLASVVNADPGELVISFGDLHVYQNHFEQVALQLQREPRDLPTLSLAKRGDIDSFRFEDFALLNYDAHPSIKAPIAV